MSELIFFRESPSGIDYTTFADIPKILSKLIISKTLQTNKRNLIVLSMGLLLIFGGLLISSTPKPADSTEIGFKKVVIDAGHGGKDPGAIGVNGIREKDIVLYIAQNLGNKIKKDHPEIEVVYTRDTDVFIPLNDRAKIANEKTADLFISIHANSAGSSQAYGTESYVLGLHRSKENLDVAKRENSAILMEDDYHLKYEGFDPNSDESYIALTLQQSVFLDQSLSMASKVQDELLKEGSRNRGVKQAGFLVLYKTTMPSLLVEVGYVTNPKEGANLKSTVFKDKIVNAIYRAFSKYKSEINAKSALSNVNKTVIEPIEPLATNKIFDGQVVFKVQVSSLPHKIELTSKNFKGLEGVTVFKTNVGYKYLYGNETEFEKAVKLQRKVRESAYKDAFIVAFYNEKKIAINEAFKIIESKASN
tara:strand:+ start:3513 stop:4769 length:1257 start_codon:yes stop_codon:yes gene_type:complete